MPTKSVKQVARGLAMGLADSVPGVSGGTMAFLLGFHPRLVRAIAGLDMDLVSRFSKEPRAVWKEHDLSFLGLVALGIAIGIIIGAKLLSIVLELYPQAFMAVLLGVVAASVQSPARVPHWDRRDIAWAVGTGVVAFGLGIIPGLGAPTGYWFLPIAGAIAAMAMILPGISGAYLLVLMGLYEGIIHAVAELDILVMLLVGVGAVIGIIAFSRVLRAMLERYRGATHAAMVGLLAGSLIRLWPWRSEAGFAMGAPAMPDTLLPVAFLAVGILIGVVLDRIGHRMH